MVQRIGRWSLLLLGVSCLCLASIAASGSPDLTIISPVGRVDLYDTLPITLWVEGLRDAATVESIAGFAWARVIPRHGTGDVNVLDIVHLRQENTDWVDQTQGIAQISLIFRLKAPLPDGVYAVDVGLWIVEPHAGELIATASIVVQRERGGVDLQLVSPGPGDQLVAGQPNAISLLVRGSCPPIGSEVSSISINLCSDGGPCHEDMKRIGDDTIQVEPWREGSSDAPPTATCSEDQRITVVLNIPDQFVPENVWVSGSLRLRIVFTDGLHVDVEQRVTLVGGEIEDDTGTGLEPIVVERTIRAFSDGCGLPVLVLPGHSAWVRLVVDVHRDVPAIILEESIPDAWNVRRLEPDMFPPGLSAQVGGQLEEGEHFQVIPILSDAGPMWVLVPTQAVFRAGQRISLFYEVHVGSAQRAEEHAVLPFDGYCQWESGGAKARTAGDDRVRLVPFLPLLTAIALLDGIVQDVRSDSFEYDDEILMRRYVISSEQFDMAKGLIGGRVAVAGQELTPERFLEVARHYASGQPVVAVCPSD